ncbi:hypothetical protein ACVW0Y_003562 [Pseudomonas sp. TE3786]
MLGRRLLPLLFLGCVLPLQAQVYTWVDENGQKHFGNQPPANQAVQEVKVQQGYVSDGPPAEAASDIGGTGSSAGKDQPSDAEMCDEAMRWTVIDMANLKETVQAAKQKGRINADQANSKLAMLAFANGKITRTNCLASKGKDRKNYECLSRGGGVMACSGALEAMLNKKLGKQ